jgi:hypothetical protein
MTISTLIFGSISFAAGIVVGVVMHEQGVLNSRQIRDGCKRLVDKTGTQWRNMTTSNQEKQ